jgi:hypothetical protein
MSRYKAFEICAVVAIAAAVSCALHGQTGTAQPQPSQTQPENTASAHDPNLTSLQTVQYINNVIDQIRLPEGIDTGSLTTWPGYFAIEQSKGTLWWVRGMQTSESGWEIRFSSAQVDQLDLNALALGVGLRNFQTVTIPCKPAPDTGGGNYCWQNWVASWDDQSAELKEGHFGSIKVARAVESENQPIIDGHDYSVSPLRKQILLFNGSERRLIDVEPAKPGTGLEIYLGAANSDTAQRIHRALKYLLKKMPAAVTESDPFGP